MAYPNPVSRSVAAALAAVGLLALAPGVWAQTTGTDPARTPRVDASEGFGTTDASGGLFGETGSPFDLIHRAVLMNGTTMQDFNRLQQGHFNDAAANFRLRQQEALLQQSQPSDATAPEAPAEAP